MGKKNKNDSEIAKLLMSSRQKIRLAKAEKLEARCNCPHKGNKRLWLRPRKGAEDNDTVLKCKECNEKIDFAPIQNRSRSDKKSFIKETCKDFINLCNINKLILNGEADEKYGKMLSKAQLYAHKVLAFSKIALVDGFEPKDKKKNKKNKNRVKTNFILSGGGASY